MSATDFWIIGETIVGAREDVGEVVDVAAVWAAVICEGKEDGGDFKLGFGGGEEDILDVVMMDRMDGRKAGASKKSRNGGEK